MEILHKLHDAGHTIVMVTHDPTIAANANRVIEISDGRIIADHSKNTDIPPSNIESIEEHNSWHFYRDQFFESFLMSIQAIMAHKMRSFLTMLGIIIGIASVVSVVALGRGSQEKILENINAMGTNTVSVYPGYGYGDRRSSRIKTLTVGDAEVLKQQDYVDSVTPGVSTSGTLTYDNQSLSAQLYGVGDQYFDVRGIKLAFGRLFNEDDVTQNSQVVVIDDNTKNKLFADGTNPLGKVILFNKRPLRIIGVTEPNNNGFSDSDSLQLFTPYTTLMNRISGSKYITSVTVKVKDNVNSQTAEKGIIELLKVRHGTEDFLPVTVTLLSRQLKVLPAP